MRYGLLGQHFVHYEHPPEVVPPPTLPSEREEFLDDGPRPGQPRRVSHPALEAQITEQQAAAGVPPVSEVPPPVVADPPEPAAQPPASVDEGEVVVPPEGEPPDPTTEQRYEIGGRLRTPTEADEAFQHSRDEVDKWRQKAIEAEADARAKTQLADTYAQRASAPPPEELPPDPFREKLADAGIEPGELDRYLDQRMEQTLAGMGAKLTEQQAAQTQAEARVLEANEGFNRPKLDAFMAERGDLKPAYEAAVAANLESGLTLGWNLLSAEGNAPPAEVPPVPGTPEVPAAPGARRAMAPTQRKVETPAPGTALADQKKMNDRAEEEGWDTESGTRALRSRFGGSLHPGLAQPPPG